MALDITSPGIAGYSKWRSYPTKYKDAPKHTGQKYLYGPFTVTDKNTDVSSDDFMRVGEIVVVGEGWTGGLDSTHRPSDFYWGLLIKQSNADDSADLYFLSYFKKTSSGVVSYVGVVETTVSSPNFSGGVLVNGVAAQSADVTAANIGSSGKLYNKFGLVDKNEASSPYHDDADNAIALAFVAYYGGRIDAYRLSYDNGFVITRSYSDKVSGAAGYTPADDAPQYFRVRDITTGSDKEEEDSGDELRDFARGGGYIYPASTPAATLTGELTYGAAATDVPATKAEGHIYFEQTWYGDDGKAYRTHSDRVPVAALRGDGDLTLDVRLWQGPTPIDKEVYPYEVRKLRFQSARQANYGFWVG